MNADFIYSTTSAKKINQGQRAASIRRAIWQMSLWFVLLCAAIPALAVTRYVKPTGNDGNTGASWAQAYLTLQKALEVSNSGDQIWVAAGTYRPTKDASGSASPSDNRTKRFTMKSGVVVYGGFNATETLLSQRNYTTNVTILSGDLSGDDNNSANYRNFETDLTRDDNCYNVVVFPAGVTTSAVLDGFTVTKGQMSIFDINYGGGGVVIHGSGGNAAGTVRNCIITRCYSDGKGGGLLLFGSGSSATATIDNVSFSQNLSKYGGGGSCDGGFFSGTATGTYTNCTWDDNYSGNYGLGHSSIQTDNGIATTTSTGGIYRNHTGNVSGETMYGGSVCLYNAGSTSTVIGSFTNCTFYNNRGTVSFTYGAGIGLYSQGGPINLMVNRSTFVGNVSTAYGGAISNMHQGSSQPHTITVTNSFFSGNSCNASGGGHAYGGYSSSESANDVTNFTNCTFTGNGSSSGSPVLRLMNGTTNVKNIILYGNTTSFEVASGYNIINSIIEGGYTGTGNLNANPLFVDADGADNTFGTLDDSPELGSCSPAINTGTNSGAPSVDLYNNTRPFGSTTDMGATERQSAPSPAPTTANAGSDQTGAATCGLTQVTLAGNTPSVGTGLWSVVIGSGGSFGNTSSPTSTFTGTPGTNYTLRWSISNSPCPASTDDVFVTFTNNPTTSNAGPDQNTAATCGLTQVTLAANAPTVGTGAWSIVSGSGGSFSSTSNRNATFTGTAGSTYTLRWTISSSPCPASTDDVVITFNRSPTASNAGPDQSAPCGTTQVTLAANAPTVGTGAWSVVSGSGGSFGNTTSSTSTFSGTAGTTYTLRWTISNSPCPASTDDVTIAFSAALTTANAGPDQTGAATCGLTQVTLAANTPTTGTGDWSVVSGTGGSFGSASSPTSTFSGTVGNTYTLRWTISGSPCTPSTDDVVITFNRNPTTANAGPDQTGAATCGLTQVTLAANAPTVGTGQWSIVSGTGGSFSNAALRTATFTGTAGSTYTLRWTISNSPCPVSTDDVVIEFSRNPTIANAGPDQTGAATCGLTQVTLAANSPTLGTGAWSVVSGTGGSFGNASSPTSTFTGTAGSTYTLRWTISNSPCPASTDDVTITFNRNPTTANAGPDQTDAATCGLTQVTLAANTPTIGTGAWSVVSGTGGSFGTASSPTSTFTGTAGTTYTLRWTISNSPCTASTDDVVITFNRNPTAANAGPDQSPACGVTQVTLAANNPAVGTGGWSVVSGTGGSFGNATSRTSTFSGTVGSTYTLRWTVSNSPCAASTDDVVITFSGVITTANAGPDQTGAATCGLTQVTLAANTPVVGTGAWSVVSGTGGSFGTASSPTSTFTGTAGSTYTLRWTISSSPCTPSTDDIIITFNRNPTTANAGPDQSPACGLTQVTLAANSPSVGTGAWSVVSGTGGSFGTASSPTSTFSGVTGNTYTLRWTISNNPCTASTDDVVITFATALTTANAGPDQTGVATCGLTQVTLAANAPTVGTGAWSVVSGTGGSFGTASSPASTFTGTAGSTYTLRWTISGSPCTPSTDDVVITFSQNPTTANAGADQTGAATCGLTQVTLAANSATVGTGAWSVVSGTGGSFGTASSPTSTFNGTAGSTYTLRWTITNSPCPASTDDVVITFNRNPTTANAGPDQTSAATCSLTQVTLAANAATVGTGTWSVVSGTGGSFGTASSPTSTFSGTAGTTYTLRWTISNSPCPASTDDVVITFNQNPTTANAGADQTGAATCGLTQVTLAANSPTAGTGAWSVVSGTGGSFGTVSSPTSTFSGTTGSTYTLRWTISNNPCTASADDVVVTFNRNPTIANAGSDQSPPCGTNQVTLAANAATVGTGAWSMVSGTGGSFGTVSSPTSTFSGTAGNTYTLRWTISNNPCPASTDDVVISFSGGPTTANAGPDQTSAATCGLTQVTLAGNTPTTGTGAWSVVSGTGGSFGTASSPTSTFTGTAGSTYTLRWTISSNPCTSSDDVVVTFNQNPTTANAGPDQTGATTCGLTQVTLAANAATVGTGAWSVVSGTGGSFGTASSPTSTFSGTAGSTYTLRWTISSNPCPASTDDVVITFNRNPTTANAGADQTSAATCGLTQVTLAANSPTVGTGAWSVVTGTGSSFGTASSPTSTFSGTAGTTYTLRWTISNSPCTASTDDVVITFNQNPTTANAGADQTGAATCGLTQVTLAANAATVGTGVWSVVSGTGGSFGTASSPTSTFTGTAGSTYTLRWTISNSPCPASTDDVVITFNRNPTTANAGLDRTGATTCGLTQVTLAANSPTVGTGAWSVVAGTGGSFGNASSPTSTFSGTAGSTYTLRWTVSNSPCTASTDDVVITFNVSTAISCPAGTTVEDTDPIFALSGGSPVGGTYSGPGVSGGMFNPAAANVGANTITYSYSNPAGCVTSCTFTITVNASCTPLTWYLDADNDGYYTGTSISACTSPGAGYRTDNILGGNDCNDNNNAINPAATEVCDGIDNNCNGSTDEGVTTTYYADVDGDGFGNPAVSQQACSQPINYVLNNTDCNDNDPLEKPGQLWYADVDNDGYSSGTTLTQCLRPVGYKVAVELTATSGDCNDANHLINPAAVEVCDGVDNNCNGMIDDGLSFVTYYTDADNDGYGTGSGQPFCSNPGSGFATQAGDCNDGNHLVNPGATEICDGIDNNCNGSTDEGVTTTYYADLDNDGYSSGMTLTQCSAPSGYKLAGALTATSGDCNDNNNTINPAAVEVCDGVDNNCNGVTDEGCTPPQVSIHDPCTCVNNSPVIPNGTTTNVGTFSETVEIQSPSGQTWTIVTVTGLYSDVNATLAYTVGTTIPETGVGTGVFDLLGYHRDGVGYTISVTNGDDTLAIGNTCYYPDPVFTGLPALVSPNAAPFQVTGTVANNAAGTGTFILDGNTQVGASAAPTVLTINPKNLTPGAHTLVYSFDAGTPGAGNPNDPGCVQQVSQRFQVANCGCQDVTVSLDADCQFVLTGNLVSDVNCGGGTVRVMDNNPGNGNIIDCAGVWTYGLFDAFGNIICWGKVTAEDKTAPLLVCAPADFTLDCYDVNYILNNYLTIGNVGATSSPRPTPSSKQTIANAEGVAGTGDNCQLGLVPPGLVADNIKNLGYAYFKDNCYNCGCRITLKWTDKVEFYSCEQTRVNGGYYATIFREWVATDCNGMRSSYVQSIFFTRPAINDFAFNGPGEGKYDRVVTYNSCTPDKSLIKKEDVTPYVCSYFNTSANPRCLFIDQVECNYSVQIKDTEFPICGGKGVKIDRELYVFDWCAGGIVDTFHILIKIGDFEAPTLEYAHHAPFDISTGPMDCTAAIPVTVTGIKSQFGVTIKDNCTLANISVSVKTKDRYVKGILVAENVWEKVDYAVMNGLMIGLPVGRHRLIVDASDGCYNAKRDSFEFNVVDKIAPVMKCDDDLHVTLSNANGYTSGYAQVSADDIDEGSWDNCKLAWIAVRRNVPDACAASFIAKGYDTNGNGKLDALGADNDYSKADGFDLNGDGDIADFGETFILKGGKLMTPLADFVEFFCCDLTERVTVELWGGDTSGNTNYCWMDLLIEDKVAPTCIAPWDLTIFCDDKNIGQIDNKLASAKIFGDVTIPTGNDCAALDTVYSTVKSLKCGAGYIDRIWTLTKQTVKGPITITCKQRINILPVHEYNICFPKDISTDCKTPVIDTVLTDELACDILAVNVSDKRYDASDDECYKIFRTYTVINWCVYDDRCGDPMAEGHVYVVDRATFGNYGKAPLYVLVRDVENNQRDGIEEFYLSKDLIARNADDIRFRPPFCEINNEFYHSFMYTQIIKVYDDIRPVVTGPAAEFCIREGGDCLANIKMVVNATDNCTDKIELETQYLMIAPNQTTDAGKMILYSTPRWSTKDLGNGQFEINVSNLPEGKHDLIVVVRDECGNLSVATRIPFTVKDCKGPAPICINGLSTELMSDGNGGGMMAVWASDFIASKIYDCNGQGPETLNGLKLVTKYSINRVGSPVVSTQPGINLTCADKGKVVLVELHAWDNAGNHDFCVTYVEVQDNRAVCPGSSTETVNIAGTITTESKANLQGASVTLSGAASQSATTPANGGYSFLNLTKGGDFTVTPQLDKNHLNGVSTFDLVLIQKHILGVQALNSPYKMIAADVNNSKSISTLDLIQLRKLILNIDTHFANNTSWRFVDASYHFPNATNPWSAAFPEVVSVNDIANNATANFIAIKVGDVNASATVSSAASAEIRTNGNFELKTQEQNLKAGNEYKVTFTPEDLQGIQGYQFALNLDQSKVELLDIEYGVAKAEHFGIFKNEGLITTSWNAKYESGALFTLILRAKADSKLSQSLILNRLVHAEAYDQNNENLGIKLAFEGEQISDSYELKQNTPNPFGSETNIGFSLPKAMKATLTVRDVKGALLYKVEGNYSKGQNQVTLKKEQLGASGVLYYTLETSDFTATKKMIILQ